MPIDAFPSAVSRERGHEIPGDDIPSPPVIRLLRREDREPIRSLLIETGVFTDDEIEIALELVDAVLTRSDQNDYQIFVYDAGTVLGYYCVGPTPATEATFDLYWIAVAPSTHRKGVGAALIVHAEALVRSHGGRLVIAETSSQAKYEPTRRFYLRQGYSELSRIRDYYRVGDDLVIYGKYLS
jgi:ribosomal protein S18 acetylase RimI-like enzyme